MDSKADTSPVTEADRQAEAAMKALIHDSFPSHDVFGEEGGLERGQQPEDSADPKYLWVIDPIDGTKSFITGVTGFLGMHRQEQALLRHAPCSMPVSAPPLTYGQTKRFLVQC